MNLTAWADKDLIQIFQTKMATFEKIRVMINEDHKKVGYISTSYVEGKISPERKGEYMHLLSEIDSGLGVGSTGSNDAVRFIFASGGLSAISPGWAKWIEYLPDNIEREGAIAPNLDKARLLPADSYLRQIQPKWFIFYERTDD